MKNLYDADVYRETVTRVNGLGADTIPAWGDMTAAQMMAHCAEVVEVFLGTKPLENTPFVARLFKGVIRKMVLSAKPYPHGIRTHPQYLVRDDRVFAAEQRRLLADLETFFNEDKEKAARIEHAMFGAMTPTERGEAMYKHLDHHLSQFGA